MINAYHLPIDTKLHSLNLDDSLMSSKATPGIEKLIVKEEKNATAELVLTRRQTAFMEYGDEVEANVKTLKALRIEDDGDESEDIANVYPLSIDFEKNRKRIAF